MGVIHFIFLTWSFIDLDLPKKARLANQQVHLPRVPGGWTRCDPRLTLAGLYHLVGQLSNYDGQMTEFIFRKENV